MGSLATGKGCRCIVSGVHSALAFPSRIRQCARSSLWPPRRVFSERAVLHGTAAFFVFSLLMKGSDGESEVHIERSTARRIRWKSFRGANRVFHGLAGAARPPGKKPDK